MMNSPGRHMRVALFATCINDIMFPDTPTAVADLLTRLGCMVDYSPVQTCCGQMFTNTGYFNAGLKTVRTYIDAFEDYDYIVAPSASCVGSVRHQHQMLAQNKPRLRKQVDRLVARTYDLSEFLVDVLKVTDVGATFRHKVTYHPTCHSLRVARVGDRPLQLLRAVKGLDLIELPEALTCCGFGGTFSVKNPDVSAAMAGQKADNVVKTGAEFVVTGDNACLMNIGGILHRRSAPVKPIHLASILVSQEA
ncbi:MAG: (Fe-S)-binding protein [Propionibacteriaceae bacterium]|nr:(Fe-S)-binding protein [Propionibacteriaceae bacterium]